jgi:hypothetical protein
MDDKLDCEALELALTRLTDQQLRALWQDGLDSGDAGEIDFVTLKAEARRQS